MVAPSRLKRRRADGLRKEVVGVELVVANEFIDSPMERVASRAGDQVHLGAGLGSERRRIIAGCGLELLHAIDAGREGIASVLVFLYGGSIEQV